jgi:hypothetical protein
VAELQWWAVAKVAAAAGAPPDRLTRAKFDAASARLLGRSSPWCSGAILRDFRGSPGSGVDGW